MLGDKTKIPQQVKKEYSSFIIYITSQCNFVEYKFVSTDNLILEKFKKYFDKNERGEYIIDLNIIKNTYGTDCMYYIKELFRNSHLVFKNYFYEEKVILILKSLKNLLDNPDICSKHDSNHTLLNDSYNVIYTLENRYSMSMSNNTLIQQAGIALSDFITVDMYEDKEGHLGKKQI